MPGSPGRRPEALLLLGPTGAGKTPLGDLLQAEGLWGRACHHLDFGESLRRIASGAYRPLGLADADVAYVRRALETGALLDDDAFGIAACIVRDRLAACGGGGDLLVLNGLPRHAGQARDLGSILAVVHVVHLDASPDAVRARIRDDVAGDRRGRADDRDVQAVEARLRRFHERTRPLIRHYEARGARMHRIPVGARTRPDEVRDALEARGSGAGPV